MTDVTTSRDHLQNALDRLPYQFSEKPVINAFIETWEEESQNLEDLFLDIKASTKYLTATGVNLNKYAHALGLKRKPNESDFTLKNRINIEIARRGSDGSPDKIREIIEAVSNATYSRIIHHPPSAILVYSLVTGSTKVNKAKAEMVKVASPVETGTTVYGLTNSYDTLLIPAEFSVDLSIMAGKTSGTITNIASNGAGGTRVTSASHGLINGNDVTIKNIIAYNGVYTIFGITANTFDIAIVYSTNPSGGTWYSEPHQFITESFEELVARLSNNANFGAYSENGILSEIGETIHGIPLEIQQFIDTEN